MAMFEGAVVKDADNLVRTSTYTLEGESLFILTAHEVFEKLINVLMMDLNYPLYLSQQNISQGPF